MPGFPTKLPGLTESSIFYLLKLSKKYPGISSYLFNTALGNDLFIPGCGTLYTARQHSRNAGRLFKNSYRYYAGNTRPYEKSAH